MVRLICLVADELPTWKRTISFFLCGYVLDGVKKALGGVWDPDVLRPACGWSFTDTLTATGIESYSYHIQAHNYGSYSQTCESGAQSVIGNARDETRRNQSGPNTEENGFRDRAEEDV